MELEIVSAVQSMFALWEVLCVLTSAHKSVPFKTPKSDIPSLWKKLFCNSNTMQYSGHLSRSINMGVSQN